MAKQSHEDLGILQGLMEAGKAAPAIDGTCPSGQVPETIRLLEIGHARGKTVITI